MGRTLIRAGDGEPRFGMSSALTFLPANESSWEDIQAVFGSRGDAPRCQCQRFKLAPRESFGSFPADERAFRLRTQTNAGNPEAETTSGLVAYLGGEPVGWCAVEPRPAYSGLLRVYRVPWVGRSEDKADESVWAVTCIFVRAGFRGRGIAHALVRAAVEFARRGGARALEGYPMLTEPGEEITWGGRSSSAPAACSKPRGSPRSATRLRDVS